MRPRKKDRHLPSCVYLKSGSYYYVKANKWERLADNLPDAIKAYATRVSATGQLMPALLNKYILSLKVADNTFKSYTTAKNHLSKILAEYRPDQVQASDIMEIMHHFKHKPGTANVMRSFLIGAFQMAIAERLVSHNVARETKPLKTKVRDRYLTDAEFLAIRSKANDHLKLIMDVCYMTGQRIGDVVAIRHADISPDGITITQAKTRHRMMISLTAELSETIIKAKALHRSVKGLTLFHNRSGAAYRYDYIRVWWNAACKLAKVDDAHIHDIRAKAATDAEKQGLDSKALLGHLSESSHNRYLRSKDTPTVVALGLKKA